MLVCRHLCVGAAARSCTDGWVGGFQGQRGAGVGVEVSVFYLVSIIVAADWLLRTDVGS